MDTVATKLVSALKEHGIKFVFGIPSGNMIDYIEAIRKTNGIEFILTSHESTAAFMASVTGRLTGKPGACFGTFGPGATNLSTGVGCAFLDRNPVLVFTDEMPDFLKGRTVQMGINHQALFRPITKWTTHLIPNRIREIIFESAQISLSDLPGPVHIGVPAGIGNEEIIQNNGNPFFREKKIISDRIINIAIKKAAELISKAKKPILAIGLNAVQANISSTIIEFADKLQAPVVLTPMAKGIFPENHPLYAGVLFHALSNRVAKTYSQADLVIGIGYDPVEFNYEDWMPNVLLIHINTFPADVDEKKVPYVLNVVNDIKETLQSLLKVSLFKNGWDLKQVQITKTKMFRELAPKEGSFGPRAVVAGLRNQLPQEGILTVDVGAHLHLVGQQWLTPAPEKLLMTNGWSSMGFAVPAAMAAKLINPGLPVACLMGDGGFRMMAGELATARRLNLQIVFVVILDNSLSLIDIKQGKKRYNREYGTRLDDEIYPASDYIFGVPVIRVENSNAFQNALVKAFSMNSPVLIEAVVDGSEYDELVLKPNK
ncbi:MAG: thiamine pyrophosphate-binding protein [Prolixibacteraceae bacterium]|nr:thiamine pyrophosphate-binding protein [Prolixibacteraceae bacterium]